METILSDYRWDYVLDGEAYTQCAIKVPNSGGKVNVDIRFSTGIILIYGTNYKTWVDRTFKSWRSLTVDGIYEPVKDIPKLPVPNISDDMNSELEKLWSEHSSLKNAVETLDTSVTNLTNEVKLLNDTINELKASQDDLFKEDRIKFDQKVSLFLKTASEECDGNISKCKICYFNSRVNIYMHVLVLSFLH